MHLLAAGGLRGSTELLLTYDFRAFLTHPFYVFAKALYRLAADKCQRHREQNGRQEYPSKHTDASFISAQIIVDPAGLRRYLRSVARPSIMVVNPGMMPMVFSDACSFGTKFARGPA